FQHANVRLRFPGLRWVINTPEWHHWHHAIDAEARDRNFGLPIVDTQIGTANLPEGARLTGFCTHDPVPQGNYWSQLAYPFRRKAHDRSDPTGPSQWADHPVRVRRDRPRWAILPAVRRD
ncbi:MAG: hypothetical protein ABWY80_01575, partial [Acidimicrobiia bacterium]